MSGDVAAIGSGLQSGDVVITDGQDKLQSGSKIEPRTGNGQGQRGQQQQSQDSGAPTQ
jgi:hypothetical protein